MSKRIPPTVIIRGDLGREVAFFLRLHRHLPDKICEGLDANDEYVPFGNCMYREDGAPINRANDYVSKLQKNEGFRIKEREVAEAAKKQIALFEGKKMAKEEAFINALKASGIKGMK